MTCEQRPCGLQSNIRLQQEEVLTSGPDLRFWKVRVVTSQHLVGPLPTAGLNCSLTGGTQNSSQKCQRSVPHQLPQGPGAPPTILLMVLDDLRLEFFKQ